MQYLVHALYIYPVKSLAGICINTAKVEENGFENDRRWMLIDHDNRFITQRKYPILNQFFTAINNDKLEISFQNSSCKFSLQEQLNELIISKVWDDDAKVFEVNKLVSKWFTDALGFDCKLVKILNANGRQHYSSQINTKLNVSLADGYPYLLIGSESLTKLNEKLNKKITIERFRPNIVFSSFKANEEDNFENFRIGNVNFKNAKPCGRCIMINNNPNNGTVEKEPLKTLSSYRKVNNQIYFGTNCISLNEGTIAVGDELILD